MTEVQELRNRLILLVEDEALVALELEFSLQDAGASKVVVASTLEEALLIIESEAVSAAIIDFRLGAQEATPVATLLHRKDIPFLIHTGHADVSDLSRLWPGTPVVKKPTQPSNVVAALTSLLRQNVDDQRE